MTSKNILLEKKGHIAPIHQGLSMTLDQGLDFEIERWSYLYSTEDQKKAQLPLLRNASRCSRENNIRTAV